MGKTDKMIKEDAVVAWYKKDWVKQILIPISVFILLDAMCFTLIFVKGWPLYGAILAGFAIAAFIDIFAFLSSYFGLGYLFNIPAFWKVPELTEVRNHFILACLALIVLTGATGAAQIKVFNMRHIQFNENVSSYEKALANWESIRYSDVYEKAERRCSDRHDASLTVCCQQNHDRKRPKYTNFSRGILRELDWFSLYIPILTTLVSFVLGLFNAKKFTVYKDKMNEAEKEISNFEKTRDDLIQKICSENKLNELREKTQTDTQAIEAAAETTGFYNALYDIVDAEKKHAPDLQKSSQETYSTLYTALNDALENNVADDYKTDVDALVDILDALVVQIRDELSAKSKHPEYFTPKTFHQWLEDNESNGQIRYDEFIKANPAITEKPEFGGTS